jgi:hypothetical protein
VDDIGQHRPEALAFAALDLIETELSSPFERRVRKLARKRVREYDPSEPRRTIVRMQALDVVHVRAQHGGHRLRQHDAPVFLPFAAPDGYLATLEVDRRQRSK